MMKYASLKMLATFINHTIYDVKTRSRPPSKITTHTV